MLATWAQPRKWRLGSGRPKWTELSWVRSGAGSCPAVEEMDVCGAAVLVPAPRPDSATASPPPPTTEDHRKTIPFPTTPHTRPKHDRHTFEVGPEVGKIREGVVEGDGWVCSGG